MKSQEKPLESDPSFNREVAEYSAAAMDRQHTYQIGEMWELMYLDPRDQAHHFATVLKINEGNYRFFNNREEANVQRVLRGLPEAPNRLVLNVGFNIYRPKLITKFVNP